MSTHLLLICLFLFISISPSASASYPDLINYTRQVSILHDMLKAEGCEDPILNGKQKREVLGASDQLRYDLKVEVQKRMYRQLEDILIECRSAAFRNQASTASQTSTTSETTTTTISKISTTASRPATTHAPTECQSALNLTEGWRQDHKGSKIQPKNGLVNCDTKEMIESGRPWFRFSGDAGNRLMNKCVPYYSCGTHAALWSDDTMPTQVGIITQVNAYGRLGYNCRHPSFTKKISVVRCSTSPHDYIYRYDGFDDCSLGFCGMTA